MLCKLVVHKNSVCVDTLFNSLIIVLTCIKNRSLSDLCMNILNKLGLCAYVCVDVLCSCFVFVLFLLAFQLSRYVLFLLMCGCRILIKITYLLTYV